jgi:hypothetical protein
MLNVASGISAGIYGQPFLAMSKSKNPAVAILASTFIPPRQLSLPACTLYSLLNAEIQNNLGWMIQMYIQMFTSPQITFLSGYGVLQQSVVEGSFTVDLKNGGEGRDRIFCNVRSSDPDIINEQMARWYIEGIKYDPAEPNKLRLPVHNMNDLLFAYLLQASNFGNAKVDDAGCYGTTLIYAGHSKCEKMYSLEIHMDGSKFRDGMAKLKEQAKVQQQLGYRYMRVATTGKRDTGIYGHAENIDINALLALDLDNMELDKAYPIGDRNWIIHGGGMSSDIPHLAVKKVDGTPPTYEFGTLKGSVFKKEDVLSFDIFNTKIGRFKPLGFFNFLIFRHFLKPLATLLVFLSALLVFMSPSVVFTVYFGSVGFFSLITLFNLTFLKIFR